SYFPNSRSRYTTLTRTIANPQTKKDVLLAVVDEEADPVLDDQGRIKFDPNHRPIFRIKGGVPFKRFFWNEVIGTDAGAYDWFRETIYSDQSIPYIWRPAWLGAILIFIVGTILLTSLDMFAQRQYMKGEPVRGTRELLPKVKSSRVPLTGSPFMYCRCANISRLVSRIVPTMKMRIAPSQAGRQM